MDRLIGSDEKGDVLGVHATIRVRDQFDGHLVDAGKSLQWPRTQARELPAIAGRENQANLIDLLFNERVVLYQPFRCRRLRTVLLYGLRNLLVRPADDVFVLCETPQEHLRTRTGGQHLCRRQPSGMTLQLRATEEAFAKRGLYVVRRGEVDHPVSGQRAQALPQCGLKMPGNSCQSHDPLKVLPPPTLGGLHVTPCHDMRQARFLQHPLSPRA